MSSIGLHRLKLLGLRRPLQVWIGDNVMGQSVPSPASRCLPGSAASAPLEKQPLSPQTVSQPFFHSPPSPAARDMS